MIPTRLKAELPRRLSCPVGAEAISGALAGVSHVEPLSVAFLDRAGRSASEFRRLRSRLAPYKIMEAVDQPARKPGISAAHFMVEAGWYDEKWELLVYPVLSECRHTANRLLREQGMPAVVRWLKSSDRAGWVERSRRVELVFSPADASLAIQESRGV